MDGKIMDGAHDEASREAAVQSLQKEVEGLGGAMVVAGSFSDDLKPDFSRSSRFTPTHRIDVGNLVVVMDARSSGMDNPVIFFKDGVQVDARAEASPSEIKTTIEFLLGND